MTESAGEVKGMKQYHDSILLTIMLEPENSSDPMQIWEWKIGAKVKVVENEL